MQKAFIFDWSGTLSDNFHCFAKVIENIFKELGKEPLSEDELRREFTTPYMTFWNRHIPELTKEKQNKMFEKYTHQAGDPDLYPGVAEIVNFLHANGFLVFVISSDPVSKFNQEVERSGLINIFTEHIGDAHVKKDEIIRIKKQYNLDPVKTFYVGDTQGDIIDGKESGIKTIGITWGFQVKERLAKSNPDFLIDDISEIKELVTNL